MDTDASRLEEEFRDVFQNKGFGKLMVYVVKAFKVSAGAEWSVSESDGWLAHQEAEAKGFVRPIHASFELYKQKKYMMNWSPLRRHRSPTSEDFVLLDPEAEPDFENINPGTVTVEGYGIECWDFEDRKTNELKIHVNRSRLPVLPAKRVLRRLDELSNRDNAVFGSDKVKEELDLQEMVGNTYMIDEDKNRWVGELYSLLNRTDVFTDFSQLSSIGSHVLSSGERFIGLWNFLRQVIVAKELAMRLQAVETADNYAGFTWRTLSSLIVSDLWLRHVDMAIVDTSVDLHGIEIPDTIAKSEAERFKEKGDVAMSHRKYQEAFETYSQAINVDLRSAIYRSKRSDASLSQGNYPEAEEDAHIATLLDPKFLKAWSNLGLALLKQGYSRRAETVYKKALEIADGDATPAILQRLADARSQTQQTISDINKERSLERKHYLQSEFFAQDFETQRKEVEWHSRIHQQQMEGLLIFAQRLKWPYLDETQAYAKEVYSSFRDSGSIDIHMWDWLFGLVFPGKWFALKIMAALVHCSPSIRDNLGAAPFYECGLALPDRSYLRSRTVLARVLGCLPGVVSVCGWIGPCPALIFDEPVDESKPRYVRIKTQVNSPLEPSPTSNGIELVGPPVQEVMLMQKRPWETVAGFVNDIKDPRKWTSPDPPARDQRSYKLKEVRVSKLPADTKIGVIDRLDAESQAEYRASLVFELNNSHLLITYKLFNNPIFVTLPPCRSQALHGASPGLHEFHERELPLFEGKIWSIGELKDYTPGGGYGGVSVINATGEGAEVIARAWCSERGRNATIRRPGGPCFACALRATNNSGLGIGVLIWVG